MKARLPKEMSTRLAMVLTGVMTLLWLTAFGAVAVWLIWDVSVEGARPGLWDVVLTALTSVLILAPVSIAVIWWTVRRFLRPIRRLRTEIGDRDSANLTPIALTNLPAELLPVAQSVDRLLDRVRRALEAEKAFTEKATDELRIPVRDAMAEADRLIAATNHRHESSDVERLSATLARLSEIVEKLHQLAKADSARPRAGAEVRIVPLLEQITAENPWADRERIAVKVEGHAETRWPVDAEVVTIILRNLIENGLRHGGKGATVRVVLDLAGAIRVANDGPIVPPDRFLDFSRAFVRGAGDSAGAGLGLAIVRALIARSPLRLTFLSPAHDRVDGVEAVLTATGETARPAAGPVNGYRGEWVPDATRRRGSR